ncbi:MAG: zinc ribbon domain-containing protein [Candidatus Thermoplasmatota archaeon]|nr:zinc ribbon domain-containing protein [Candidatus Thermoplasmatota archaeon]
MGIVGKCIYCGKENEFNAERCVKCGRHLGRDRECPKCGIKNSQEAKICRICGANLDGMNSIPEGRPTERPGYRPRVSTCKKCGRTYDSNLIACPVCDASAIVYDRTASRSSIPLAAGTLLAIAGFLNIFNGLVLGMLMEYFEAFAYCGLIEILFGAVALFAWVFCMRRAHRAFVVVACIITIISIGPFFLSTLLGILALILVLVSWKEFG